MIPGSLCDRWATRVVNDIGKTDVRGVVDEARSIGIPGRGNRTEGPSDARERELAGALRGMFDWLLRDRDAIDVDPTASLPPPSRRASVIGF